MNRRGFLTTGLGVMAGLQAQSRKPYKIDVHHHFVPPKHADRILALREMGRTPAWTPETVGAKTDEAFVEFQPLDESPLESKETAEDAQDIDVIGGALEDPREEFQLEIELLQIGLPRWRFARWRRSGVVVELLARLRHRLPLA